MIEAVRSEIDDLPLIVGGGIRTQKAAAAALQAGADCIVVGNSLEEEPELLGELAAVVKGMALQP